ncbi:VCBS repeat protein [Solirubrobacter pauli]|uniref:VCBS repeat protein n=1 Tax=Solirubrobacter pauli TaxID=166793 RepID=A0A660L2B0_9ACTN|nr:VCBS repeat-containing protein [Solirubrobacter pauli]RKQ88067.1 VCBS repeat protein [Solirubrobacter pauli]
MKRLGVFVVAALALLAGTAWAAFEQEGGPYATGAEPYAVYAGDFSGDGRSDVIVMNGSSSSLNYYVRQPGGGFADGGTIDLGPNTGPSFAAVADYNGDGRADLAVAKFVGQNVNVLLQQPSGGLAREADAGASLDQLSAIGAGDFNSDGRTDLVVARWNQSGVTLLLRNAGNNGFTSSTSFATGTNPRQIDVADFNGDSLPDIAITNAGSGSVTVLRRTGTTFTSEGNFSVGAGPQDLTIADFNRDGFQDIAVANNTSGTVSILLRNAANNGFDAEAGSPITVGTGPNGITTADFNLDGLPDLAVTSNTTNVLLRNAGGGFTADTPLGLDSYGIATADFDGDARPDLVITSLGVNQMRVLRNPGASQPPPPPTPTPTPPVATPTPVAGTTVNAEPVKGTVKVKLPKSNRYVDLKQAGLLPVGTTVDTRKGTIEITAAGQGGKAKFFDGIFRISQTKGARPLTTLTLTEALSCPKGKKASSAAAKKKSRKLWGDGKGSFRTAGKYSAATVRGTKWLVTDYCDRTVTKVTQGSVRVRDNVKKINKVVRKGKSYTARAKKGR